MEEEVPNDESAFSVVPFSKKVVKKNSKLTDVVNLKGVQFHLYFAFDYYKVNNEKVENAQDKLLTEKNKVVTLVAKSVRPRPEKSITVDFISGAGIKGIAPSTIAAEKGKTLKHAMAIAQVKIDSTKQDENRFIYMIDHYIVDPSSIQFLM